MPQMLYVVAPWIGVGILSILWLRALLRGRELEQQLDKCRPPVDEKGVMLAPAVSVQPEDVER